MSKFDNNVVTWFEIPTTNMTRAVSFYESLLDTKLRELPGDEPTYMFSVEKGGVGGCLVQRDQQKPTHDGTLMYLNVDGKLDATLKRAEILGASVTKPRTEIDGGLGFYAWVKDSEGNQIGLHSTMF
jgi:predicted enzyme related to lactoylglutathione lyase